VNESYFANIINTLPPGLESLESAIKIDVRFGGRCEHFLVTQWP